MTPAESGGRMMLSPNGRCSHQARKVRLYGEPVGRAGGECWSAARNHERRRRRAAVRRVSASAAAVQAGKTIAAAVGSRAVVLRFEICASRSSGTCEAGGSTCAHPVPEDQPANLVGCRWSRLRGTAASAVPASLAVEEWWMQVGREEESMDKARSEGEVRGRAREKRACVVVEKRKPGTARRMGKAAALSLTHSSPSLEALGAWAGDVLRPLGELNQPNHRAASRFTTVKSIATCLCTPRTRALPSPTFTCT
ncbi:hypothetical protein M409DRAFT_55921 [Zasmidium cellare ATCC 36951]|uniref:Uncharacterized protein n=1 Tax=Zasmidium cellare ATCC 36951 TaxID=1080233 RepID=A0A6A6CJE9_ZASCE|nr:uncharacterized protein M409DRAFT_55921 [Zasmidium cellare ATCC 36951]KAF2165546.1 hypothetical protein M409DRAFT_55921 [Zasmidium cellare ATCC 36951]